MAGKSSKLYIIVQDENLNLIQIWFQMRERNRCSLNKVPDLCFR